MKWVKEQLSQCVPGQNGHSRWNKKAASYWSEDTATSKALAEEMYGEDEEIDIIPCTKKNLATTLAPKVELPLKHARKQRDSLDSIDITGLRIPEVVHDVKKNQVTPGLISVASCDTDHEESLALRLTRFNPTTCDDSTKRSSNMRFLSLLRNVRRLESQYVETGKTGRMLASTIVELPSFVYSGVTEDPKRCAICLSDFTTDQELRVLPCFHSYHSWCIDKWLLSNCKCPVCILSP